MDYLNFFSNDLTEDNFSKNNNTNNDLPLLNKIPEVKLPNQFFKNNGNAKFENLKNQIKGDIPTFSNGAIYADLDNDGDLDIVVNNINSEALIYENKTNDKTIKPFIEIKLKGPAQNINALGAKIIVYDSNEIRTYEKYPARGFQSSMEVPVHIGLDKTKVDSILLIWPDNTYQTLQWKNNISQSNLLFNISRVSRNMITQG